MEVLYADRRIGDSGQAAFSGSGNAILRNIPNTIGTLINPSHNPSRNMSVSCRLFLQNHTKNQMEQIQYRMNELLGSCTLPNRNLLVNNNLYTNVSIVSNTCDILAFNSYLSFKLDVELDHLQPFLDSEISNVQSRLGLFEYNWLDSANITHTTTFPILTNYEAAPSVTFTQNKKPRLILSDGQTTSFNGGFHSIKLQGWISGCLVKDMEGYAANALIGPLGRQGTLSISGRTFENAVLNNFNSSNHNASSMRYSMEFISDLC